MLYKITRGLAVIPSLSLIPLSTTTRGHVQRFKIPSARVNLCILALLFTLNSKIVEQTSEHLVSEQSVEHFRELILNLSQFITTPTIIS